ncbi:MAG: hypothetical protein KAT68_11725 [Bacteroidales bacterium]|nr:hypothetical protein [Bacteroidales bacterium]
MFKKIAYILINIVFIGSVSFGQTVGFKGQLPIWTTINPENPFQMQAGIRYIPELSFNKSIKKSYSIDGELSINTYISGLYVGAPIQTDEKLKPYRIWLRFSTEQLEIRVGLQKINFGSAMILRPLMWFDRIDPRDPLQLTDGVYGILGRYYFMNNANIWLWGLIGNKNVKGWEFLPSNKKNPEFGGRIQLPFFTGEIAGSYHHREIDVRNTQFEPFYSDKFFYENRYALDLRIDKGIGFWLESSVNHQDVDTLAFTKILNLGLDYTFSLGNGLGFTSEFIAFDNSNKLNETGKGMSLFAGSLNYPVNIITSISAIVYYDFENESLYRFVNTSWTFDKWSFYAITFWNPDTFQIYSNLGEVSLYSGYGFQFMAIFNH